jgi:hypothetical protein
MIVEVFSFGSVFGLDLQVYKIFQISLPHFYNRAGIVMVEMFSHEQIRK